MHTMVHEQLAQFFRGFRRDAHPMAVMCGVVGALSAFYHDSTDINDPRQREIASHRLIAKMPTLAAMAFKYTMGQPFVYPHNDLGYTENFLRMTFSVPAEEYKVNPRTGEGAGHDLHPACRSRAERLDLDGASRRLVGRQSVRLHRGGHRLSLGPAHGGANEAALKMLEEIGTVDRIPEYIKKAKDPNDNFRLSGFGHRVYKNYDPRAKAMQVQCHKVLDEVGHRDDATLKVAMELERIALEDEYFVSRKLYPNIDFYSGITLRALGFPTSMFTALFALARTVGWIAQWKEMLEDPHQKIGRPRQIYTGKGQRDTFPWRSGRDPSPARNPRSRARRGAMAVRCLRREASRLRSDRRSDARRPFCRSGAA